jgi:hypothetical protein
MVKVLIGALAAMLLSVCTIYGFLWYASFEGELDSDNNEPFYVARDEAAFGILQRLPQDNRELLDQAVRQTGRRTLALGSRTKVRIKSELYFDGTHFRSGLLLSSKHKRQLQRVYRVQILDGSVQGLLVFVPAERFHNYAYM